MTQRANSNVCFTLRECTQAVCVRSSLKLYQQPGPGQIVIISNHLMPGALLLATTESLWSLLFKGL